MTFQFKNEASSYHKLEHGVRYPRYQAWEFVWEHLHKCGSFRVAASGQNVEKTALHLGFYLANWGMFRGSSNLLNVNMAFFIDFVEHLDREVDERFWELKFDIFRTNSEQAISLFDNTVSVIKSFKGGSKAKVSWTPTLISKILLGVWGQCPALDQYYMHGFRSFSRQERLRLGADCSGRYLRRMALLVNEKGWDLGGFQTKQLDLLYPAGKVLDMAFFHYGLRQ